MRRKLIGVVVPILVVIEICTIFLMYKSFSDFSVIKETKSETIVEKKRFSMFLQNSNGDYEEVEEYDYFPSDGYVLNTDKTICNDNKGVEIVDALTISGNNITVKSGKTVFCYLYFDLV